MTFDLGDAHAHSRPMFHARTAPHVRPVLCRRLHAGIVDGRAGAWRLHRFAARAAPFTCNSDHHAASPALPMGSYTKQIARLLPFWAK
jgi:hypothetical protein